MTLSLSLKNFCTIALFHSDVLIKEKKSNIGRQIVATIYAASPVMKVPGGLVMQLLGLGGDVQSKQLYKKILSNSKYIYICQFFVDQFKEYPL